MKAKKRTAPKTITSDQAADLFEYGFNAGGVTDKRDRALCVLLYRAGLRVGEACALRVQDIDLESGLLKVPDGVGCKSGARSTYLHTRDGWTVEAVREWLQAREAWDVTSDLLFCTSSGAALHPDNVYRSLVRRSVQVGIGKVTPHMLRHTFATERVGEGWNLLNVQAALGHRSLATTMVYLHANPVNVRKAWEQG